MIARELWHNVNAALAAKMIGEYSYEECLQPRPTGGGRYRLPLSSGVCYHFAARETVWTWLRIDPDSLTRDGAAVDSAVQLLIDAQRELQLSDITLGVLTQEIQNTLYSEAVRRQRLAGRRARELVALPGPQLQALLDGHPKLAANKGRIGWGQADLQRYAPESAQPFQLRYIALRRERAELTLRPGENPLALLGQCLDGEAMGELQQRAASAGIDLPHYAIVPVHPWQWQQFIVTQYTEYLAGGDLVDLGSLGDEFLPQQSIRTLSNVSRPGNNDIKLSLTILNTSCFRGVPGEHIAAGVAVSDWLKAIAGTDSLLAHRLTVLAETAGIHCPHPRQAQVRGTPYRYREMLGAVWRESIESQLAPGERGILMSTLMQTDGEGRALLAEYVEQSGLDAGDWLRQLFDTVVVPLYHLMCRYGVGLVAHGQNVSVILRAGRPVRSVIRDFHGDLRLVDRDFPELASLDVTSLAAIKRLPPQHLLHDLVTGHFVTTLRFISPLAEEQLGLDERRFYRILAASLQAYMAEYPELRERHRLFPLFDEQLLKVCVNRVRFRIGYEDNAERPRPELGTPIANPLIAGV